MTRELWVVEESDDGGEWRAAEAFTRRWVAMAICEVYRCGKSATARVTRYVPAPPAEEEEDRG